MNRPWDPHRSIADRKLVATSLNESFTAAIGCPLVPKNLKRNVPYVFFEQSGHPARYVSGRISSQMTDCSKKKNGPLFLRFFGTNEHPIAAVKLSLGAAATNFRSAIDLWRSQGRFIGSNEKN